MQVPLYNLEGKVVGQQELAQEVWGVKPNTGLIHEALRVQMANARQVIASTKTRGEVSGGGKKPWKQKGTGRARVGSIRSPIWKGGGTIFGPRKERNYFLRMNKKAQRKAFLMCLSDKLASDHLIVLEAFDLTEAKTKALVKVFRALPSFGKKILVALTNDEKKVAKLGRNIDKTTTIGVASLNVKDVLNYPYFLITAQGVKEVEQIFKRK